MSEEKSCSCPGPHYANCPFRHQVRNQGIRVDFSDFQRILEKIAKDFAVPKHDRNPKRISKILKRLEKIWKKNPDLRLGQLILNANVNLYYLGDSALIRELEKFYKNKNRR